MQRQIQIGNSSGEKLDSGGPGFDGPVVPARWLQGNRWCQGWDDWWRQQELELLSRVGWWVFIIFGDVFMTLWSASSSAVKEFVYHTEMQYASMLSMELR